MRLLRTKSRTPSFLPRHQSSFTTYSLTPALPTPKSSATSSPWFPILRTSIATRDLLLGKSTHARIIVYGNARDRFVVNNLISMYSKCGSLVYARYLFDEMPYRDLVTWNAVLGAYAQCAEFKYELVEEGFGLFRKLLMGRDILVSALTLSPVLKLCLVAECLRASEGVHGLAVKVGLGADGFVTSALVNIYSRCGLAKEARVLFDQTSNEDRDAVLWKVMITGYLRAGMVMEMCRLFSVFHGEGFRPDDDILGCFLGESLLDIYEQSTGFVEQVQGVAVKCSNYSDDNHGDGNGMVILSCNKTLSHRIRAGDNLKAIAGFATMNKQGFRYDTDTIVMVLAAVAGLNCLSLGQQTHSMTFKSGFQSDLFVSNSLINMYAKVGRFSSAQYLFSIMEQKDLISWNSMISICAHNGIAEEAATLFRSLFAAGLSPDPYTMASFLKACSSLKEEGMRLSKEIHAHALRSDMMVDSFVSTALVDVYARNSRVKEAEFIVNSIKESDVAVWNALIFSCVTRENTDKAFELFNQMRKKGQIPDEVTLATVFGACIYSVGLEIGKQIHALGLKLGNHSDLFVSSGILDMYLQCGIIADAEKVFRSISYPDGVAWTTMISGCVDNGDEERALHLYNQMRQCGYVPDEYTLAALVKAASCSAAIEQGKQIHANIIKLNSSDHFVGAALVDMYAKSGDIENSYQTFKNLESKDTTVWNAMLVGLAQHGMGQEAISLFQDMTLSGFQPDKVTFIGVLSACGHSNLFLEAFDHFNAMQSQYGVEPEIEHYACLVDALARGGLVQEAEKLISSIPFQPSAPMYRVLLSACRNKGDTDIGRRAAEKLIALEPSDPSPYVILYNIYASANRWDEALKVRSLMKKGSVKKDPGFSYVDTANKVHLFTSDDKSHPQADLIYAKLYEMMRNIKEEGYIPDTSIVTLDVAKEEKERSLWHHSEKLAVAFGLISTPQLKPIRVIKNIRICNDCHNAVKHISKFYKREIILRDANRFHRVVDGVCSCADFW